MTYDTMATLFFRLKVFFFKDGSTLFQIASDFDEVINFLVSVLLPQKKKKKLFHTTSKLLKLHQCLLFLRLS